ncbi:MAG: LytTR family DNA-binding domain-containing protein [Crocinitomicaceae bacterium]|nr:LytTR family DNA-binding domain-containing protein [Crocinitomicaceae bacterium]
MIRAVIIEDSELAQIELENLLSKNRMIKLVGKASDAESGIKLIDTEIPDLVFLDIHLPDMNGFELLNEIRQSPKVIFTTAYDEYAVKSFDYNTIDYLLKPIKGARLEKAISKIVLEEKPVFSLDNSIFIKDSDRYYIAQLKDVELFHTEGNYTKVFFKDKRPLLHKPLSVIEERLDANFFFRVNRQDIISIRHIVHVEKWFKGKLKLRLKCGKEVEVSERKSVRLKEMLSF